MKTYAICALLMLCSSFSLAQTFPTNFHKISRTSGDLSLTVGDGANFGITTAAIGDLDDDGVLDMAVAATNQDGTTKGAIFVLFMNADGTVDHMTEVQCSEPASDLDSFGSALTGLGDLDQDGVEDIGVGAGYDSDGTFHTGAYWILFMNTNGTVKSRQKISSAAGNFTTLPFEAVFGGGSTKLGDLDGDGVTEIAVGARNDNGTGAVYILFLNTNGTVKNFKKITSGSGGLPLADAGLFGYALSSLGDLDGDGITDVAIGAHRSDIEFVDSGVVWIVFLNANGTVKNYKMMSSNYANFTNPTASFFGVAIAGLGDYDSDGHPDMAVGGEDGSGSGALWYIMLNTDGTVKNYYKISATSSNSNISLSSGDFFGGSLANIGDLNSDGVTDIVSGAFFADDGATNSGAVWISLSSSKLSQNITFAALAPKTLIDPSFTLTATAGVSGQPVTYTSSNTAVATVSGNNVTIKAIGSTVITAHQVGDATYNPSPDVPRELVITKASQTITFPTLPAKVYGDAAFSPGATTSSGLTVSYTSSNTAVAQISSGQITIVGAGSATITARQSGNSTYNAATDVAQTLTVSKASQTITFDALSSKTYGDGPFSITSTSSSGLTTTYTSSNPAVATVSGNVITITGAGSAVITAKQAGNTNYNAATDVPQTLTVIKANQTITFGALPSKTYGDGPFTITSTSSSGLATTYTSSDPAVATVSGNVITVVGGGSAVITAKQGGNTNYNAATDVPRTLTVSKANQTITFGTLPSKTYGDAPFTLAGTSSSGLATTYSSSDPAVATVIGSVLTITGVGSVTITAKQTGNANYNAATEVPQALTVSKGNQTITFGVLPSKIYGDAPFTLTATSSSGLTTTYTSSDTNVATITGSVLTITGAGSATITAKQDGDANYNSAADIPQTLTVSKADQSISFGPITAKTMGDLPFNLVAGSSSSLQVEFTTASDKVSISGSEVTIVKPGSVSISANQTGNNNYNSATEVSQTFCINPAKPTITPAAQVNETITLTSSSSTGNQWYRNGSVINGATSDSYSATESGKYTVVVTADNCSSLPSSDLAIVITGDLEEDVPTSFVLYPNPARKFLYVNPVGFEESAQFEVSIIDLQGRYVDRTSLRDMQGAIDVESLAAGLYLVEISWGSIRHTAKFVKE